MFQDIREILPTIIILVFGLLIMAIVIPYAFRSVIRQLEEEQEMNNKRNEDNLTTSTESGAT